MRLKVGALVGAMSFLGFWAPASAAPACIQTQEILSSTPDRAGASITFKMRNGKVWRNDLQGPCPDLRFYGFAWVLHGTNEVCDDQQAIRVISSGEICVLGKFTDITPPKTNAN